MRLMRLARLVRGLDRGVLIASLVLVAVSWLAMISAAATLNPALARRHTLYIGLGIVVCAVTARTNYRRWLDLAAVFYALAVIGLILVEMAGTVRLGAARWLSVFGLSLQPSEFAKLATVLILANYLAGQPRPLRGRVVMTSLGLAVVPAVLIFMQPDLGTASVLGVIWLGMVWVAGISTRWLRGLGLALVAVLPVGWHMLKAYQRARLMAFIDPHADPLGAGYTIIQSTIAIGSGGWTGRGWLSGTQNQLNFLPERHSDFIFSVIGEEWGLVGCLIVVAAFGLLLVRGSRIAMEAVEARGRLLVVGILCWLGYQACVNMGMVMGLLPVVGLPLPLVSYGGTSMLTVWLSLGLWQSASRISHA